LTPATAVSDHENDFFPVPDSAFTPEVRKAIGQELEAICGDPNFRLSQRNCAFLRYVVTATLNGRASEIKERTLGTELFGRPATYDTGSDAVVRVRANDVRKRLVRHYEEHTPTSGWRIELPARTYVPLFLQHKKTDSSAQKDVAANIYLDTLSLRTLMAPTVVSLFFCVISLRWQMSSGNSYFDFWETFLRGRSSITLVLDADKADPKAVTVEDLHEISPLLSVAESFHVTAKVQSSADPGLQDSNSARIYISHVNSFPETSSTGPAISHEQLDSHAAYLTVAPNPTPTLWISGTDPGALALAIHELSARETFPQAVETALHRNAVNRIRIEENQPALAESVAADSGPWHQ